MKFLIMSINRFHSFLLFSFIFKFLRSSGVKIFLQQAILFNFQYQWVISKLNQTSHISFNLFFFFRTAYSIKIFNFTFLLVHFLIKNFEPVILFLSNMKRFRWSNTFRATWSSKTSLSFLYLKWFLCVHWLYLCVFIFILLLLLST